MRFAFIVDPLPGLEPCHDTSVALMEAAQRLGVELWVAAPEDLGLEGGAPVARARPLELLPAVKVDGQWVCGDRWFDLGSAEPIALTEMDAVLMRLDPPVDRRFVQTTFVLDAAARAGTLVVNDPSALRIFNEKLLATLVPELAPATVMTARADRIAEAVHGWGLAVAKPLDGMAGRGIVMLRDGDPGLGALLELITEAGRRHVVVQEYLPEAAAGDKRILLLDGEPVGAINRRSRPGEFRCNMATGAMVDPTRLDERDMAIVDRLRPLLGPRGLHFSGIDVIGGRLTEVNVTSPTGMREAELLGFEDAGRRVVEWVLEKAMNDAPTGAIHGRP